MAPPKTSRPFQQRFLDGYDRSQLRQEVQKVKPKRSFRKKYASWALGGALALGGIGIPMKFGHILTATPSGTRRQPLNATENQPPRPEQIANDLRTATQIASEVSKGVQGAMSTVAQTAAQAPAQIAQTVAQAPEKMVEVADQVKENFFKTQVPFGSIIYNEAKKNALSPELVAAVAHTESKFVPTARSGAGAIGLMQLVPRTGRWMGANNLTDPSQSIMAGAKYLRYLTDRFGGDEQKAIAAYNAGEGAVRRFGGVPPYRETQNYVQRVRNFQKDLGAQMQNHVAEVHGASPGL